MIIINAFLTHLGNFQYGSSKRLQVISMLVIVGSVLVVACVFGGYVLAGGHLALETRAEQLRVAPAVAAGLLERLLRSGLNDWGGVSPVTVDFINPEAPWPALTELRERTERAGQRLLERLPVYPDWIARGSDWTDEKPWASGNEDFFDPQMWVALPRFANDEGYARHRNTHQSRQETAA